MHRTRTAATMTALAASLLCVGCGRGGPATYPVEGRLEFAGADIAILAGSYIEAARVDDPSVRSSGAIEPDGTFALETQHAGSIRRGATAGKYQVRIILNDDDRLARQLAQKTLPTRYLAFQTSGLVLDVPNDDGITLRVSARSGTRPQAATR